MNTDFFDFSFGDFGLVADLALCNPHFGDFWPLLDGCHAVYRGQNGNIDYTEVQALMDLDDSQVTIDHQDLPPGTSWDYIRRQVSGCGLASGDSAPICKILIDENGDAFADVPNPPLNLTATAVAGGKIKLRWRYSAINQAVSPTGFNVYDVDSGKLGEVIYKGPGDYIYITGALSHGQLYNFRVRSYKLDAGESQNSDYVTIAADAVGPGAITGLRASWTEK